MGQEMELNWALKLTPKGLPDKLEVGAVHDFVKGGFRSYPINPNPIDLINGEWEAVAKVVVLEVNITARDDGKYRTTGKYKILKVYEGQERAVLTNYWRENVKITKGEDISDFSGVRATPTD